MNELFGWHSRYLYTCIPVYLYWQQPRSTDYSVFWCMAFMGHSGVRRIETTSMSRYVTIRFSQLCSTSSSSTVNLIYLGRIVWRPLTLILKLTWGLSGNQEKFRCMKHKSPIKVTWARLTSERPICSLNSPIATQTNGSWFVHVCKLYHSL